MQLIEKYRELRGETLRNEKKVSKVFFISFMFKQNDILHEFFNQIPNIALNMFLIICHTLSLMSLVNRT